MASLDITPELRDSDTPKVRRLNRLPVIVAMILAVIFVVLIVYGLSTRGFYARVGQGLEQSSGAPARSFGDRLKDGIPDGIIDSPIAPPPIPSPPSPSPAANPFQPAPTTLPTEAPIATASEDWRARLQREQEEQYLRELHRQRMLSLQADQAALDSPIAVDVDRSIGQQDAQPPTQGSAGGMRPDLSNLYAAALGSGGPSADPNSQAAKESFFDQDLEELGYLPNRVVSAMSPYELKRGSIIPATLITGINSDLPGRIIAQVSQNVFDSATGHHLLIPQGSRLFGRYDSKVTFGQRRALVIWTDIVFPNGATLQIGGMAGTDAQGYGGFADQVDNHYLEVFGSAILVAAIGAGIDMSMPQDRSSSNNNGTDAARRSFAETFGRVADRTIGKNMDVQPTIEIRPGYIFNVLVDQDIVFPKAF